MKSSQKVFTFDNLVEAAQEKKFGHAVTIDSEEVNVFQSANAPGQFVQKSHEDVCAEAFDFAKRLKAAYM